jgi:hypothetical protein
MGPLGQLGDAPGELGRHLDARAKDHVGPAPGLLVDQLPAVPGSRSILSKKDVAGVQDEVLARARLEIERAA